MGPGGVDRAMAGGGHALWQVLGARTTHVGLVEAVALVIAGDALFVSLLVARGGERSKIVVGIFAVPGLLASLGALAAVGHAWRTGL